MNMGFREGRYYGALEKTGIKSWKKVLLLQWFCYLKKNNQTKWPLVITHKLENHQDDFNSHHSTFYGENVI